MTSTRVYIVLYSGRPMNFQTISKLSGLKPAFIEVKGKPRVSRITGDIVRVQTKNGEWIPRINEHNSFEYHFAAITWQDCTKTVQQVDESYQEFQAIGRLLQGSWH